MKILVFENEIPAVQEAFNDVNILDFNNSLIVEYIDKSQNFSDIKLAKNFDLIFVDIDLSLSSVKDGYGIIEDLKKIDYNNIIVLTGNMVKEELESRGWNDIKILSKPIFLDELTNVINEFKNFN